MILLLIGNGPAGNRTWADSARSVASQRSDQLGVARG